MHPKVEYQISALEGERLWFVYAASKAAADHVAHLFRKTGHDRVHVKDMNDA